MLCNFVVFSILVANKPKICLFCVDHMIIVFNALNDQHLGTWFKTQQQSEVQAAVNDESLFNVFGMMQVVNCYRC